MSSTAESAMTKTSNDGKDGSNGPTKQRSQPEQSYAQAVTKSPNKMTDQEALLGKSSVPGTSRTPDKPETAKVSTTTSISTVHNPYKIKRTENFQSDRMESVADFTKLFSRYMEIIVKTEPTSSTYDWVLTWQTWTKKGIKDKNITLKKLTDIVNYPK